jgi:dimeric dUTPase (all-alpha-NTP-PPase superfamily)
MGLTENKCAHLLEKAPAKPISIQEMFDLQKKLQDFLAEKGKAVDLNKASFKDKVDDITVQFRNLTTEFAELLDRLPYKEWKSYPSEQLSGWLSDEQKVETMFEYIDMFHFFLNIGLCLGIDGEMFMKLYVAKNQENFDRQARGY